MNLYELTVDAASKVDIYKNPDIAEWIAAIDPVLSAADKSCIGSDTVEAITVAKTLVHITTSYTVRGCEDTTTVKFPIDVLMAADPVHAAKLYRLNQRIALTEQAIAASQEAIKESTESLNDLLAKKAALETAIV